MAVPSFIFGGDTNISYEDLQRRRKIAEAIAGRSLSAPQNVGEGLAAVGNALAYRFENSRLNKAEASGKEKASSLFGSIMGGMGGGASGGAEQPAATIAPSAQTAGSGFDTLPASAQGLRGGIEETASALGIDPVDLATAISYETGGTFDPTKKGPTTQWGQHRGLIQFGEPQAQKYGVNWDDPVGSQLGANGAVANYLRDTGVKPGMGLLDVYSAINAGGVGRYDRSDANNGGAPGSVRDKVEQQMAGHRAKAMALFGGAGQGGATEAVNAMAQPQQVASADPSFMPAAQAQDPRALVAQAMPQQAAQQQDAWQGMREPTAQPRPVQRVAQAMPQQGGGGPDPRLIQALSDPYMSDGQRQVLGALLKQQMSANQPMSPLEQVQMRKLQIETELLQNPRMDPADAARLEFDREKLDREEQKLTNVPAGTTVFDPKTRQPVYTAPTKPDTLSPEALSQQMELRAAGKAETNINVGEGNKFYETLDAGNAKIFSGLSEAGVTGQSKLAQIDRLEGLLNSAPQGAAAVLKQAAGEYGINTEGLSDIQAAQALINELVPQQRQPGSGPMSDADLALFKQSLPRLVNQPGGNKQILDTMRGITQYQIEMGQIADAVADRAMTPAQAREAIRSLPNPLAQLRGQGGGSGQPQAAPEPGNYRWNPETNQVEPM